MDSNKNGTGIANPAVLDQLAVFDRLEQIVLVMIEHRDWAEIEEELWKREFLAKLNVYVTYIQSRLYLDYPKFVAYSAHVRLDCLEGLRSSILVYLKEIRSLLKEKEIGFSIANIRAKQEITF